MTTNTQTNTMITAIKLSTTNDTNGNPCRLWVVNELAVDGKNQPYSNRLAVIEEGYEGLKALRKHYPDAIVTEQLFVSPKEYKTYSKMAIN